MTIKPISEDELDRFAQLSHNPARLKVILQQFWNDKVSSPENCFVAAEGEVFLAGVIYHIYPSVPTEICLWDILIPSEQTDATIGGRVISNSFGDLEARGIKRIEARIESSDHDFEIRCKAVEWAQMMLFQQKWRYEFSAQTSLPAANGHMEFQSLAKFGDDAFIDLIEAVTRHTLDRGDIINIRNYGAHGAARAYYGILKDLDYRPELWQVGFLPNGEIAGLVVPHIFSAELGAINYIGVVPAMRGKGLGLQLLHWGTKLLIEAGVSNIIGDIDTNNFPLSKSLESLNYVRKCEIYCYAMNMGNKETD